MNSRRGFVAAVIATAASALTSKTSRADGIQAVGNQGQIVSTGDVYTRQAAGGVQYFDTRSGQWVTVQTVGNDLQIVATGNVYSEQSAAGQQTVYAPSGNDKGGKDHYDGNSGGNTCTPGESYQQGQCAYWCSDQCEWMQFCCPDTKKGKCCK
jgi:hypothetical protein